MKMKSCNYHPNLAWRRCLPSLSLLSFCGTLWICRSPASYAIENPSTSSDERALGQDSSSIEINTKKSEALSQESDNEEKIVELLNPYADELPLRYQLLLARSFRQLKRYTDEIRILKKVLAKQGHKEEIHYQLGLAYFNNEQLTEATTCFREAIKLNKKFRLAYEGLLAIFQKTKNNYESRTILREMEKSFGKDATIYSHLCRLDSMDGYLDSAITVCRQAIQTDRQIPENYIYLSQSLRDKNDELKAGKTLLLAAKQFPQSEFVQWSTGEYYWQQKNYAAAQKYYIQAISADASSSRALLGLALCQFELHQYEQALQSFKQSCQLNESVSDKIREASGKLRQQKEKEWSRLYSQQVYQCKERTSGNGHHH